MSRRGANRPSTGGSGGGRHLSSRNNRAIQGAFKRQAEEEARKREDEARRAEQARRMEEARRAEAEKRRRSGS